MDLSIGCEHPVRVAGMCAICGMTVDDDSHESQESPTQLYSIAGVQINSAEAAELDSESTSYLLSKRKLALIVDLDQTILHATVDPTVGEWTNDPQNPNYSALASVGKFRLRTDGSAIREDNSEEQESSLKGEGAKKGKQQPEDEGCWYYVKQRPGLEQFLADLSTRYEMHVYTMGTRSYAESVCRLVDPMGTIFGARILSRDENGSIVQKSLKKLFPMDTSMVVIIDDRADVWEWSPNLVKVIPYDFFVGIGDINASFLPAASSVIAPAKEGVQKDTAEGTTESSEVKTETGKEQETSKEANADESEAKKSEAEATAVAESSQRTAVSEQLGSRPLARMQEALDVKNDENTSQKVKKDEAVLHDNDNELDRLQSILDQIHLQWYQRWDRTSRDNDKPATTSIIALLKARVLSSCVIVFSSVFPLQQRPESSDLWQLATEYGATCKTEIDDTVTHLVAGKSDTHKVFLAHQKKIAVVWPDWLQASCAAWYRQPEEVYTISDQLASSDAEVAQMSTESDHLLTSFDSSLPDGEEEEEEEDDDQGFGEMNWDEANNEVDAVLDGLTDEEDTGDEGYSTDGSTIKRKRIRSGRSSIADDAETPGQADEDAEDDQQTNLSPLSKRRKMAGARVGQSKLKHAVPIVTTEIKTNSSRPQSEHGDTDDDFLQSLQDELELQLMGSGEEDGQQEDGLASDDE